CRFGEIEARRHRGVENATRSVAGLSLRCDARTGSRVLVAEVVIPPGNEFSFGKLLDLEMLMLPGGVERTEAEYRELLRAGRFRLSRVLPTQSSTSLVEGIAS